VTNSHQTIEDNLNAFCQDSDAYLAGVADGPLSGLTFAAKDIFDVAGHVTGAGNPDWKATHEAAEKTAWAVQTLVEAGATMVGKTMTDELTRGIFGENVHYGTPVNPRAPGRVPGGSSSGSASAVAGGLVDFALGSDTLGSVRIPASYCGLYGLRPTHGRISLDGVLLQAPTYDTVGWSTRDVDLFAKVGAVLLQNEITAARPRRVVIAEDAFELANEAVAQALQPIVEKIVSLVGESTTERLASGQLIDWLKQQVVLQGHEAWASIQDWIDQTNPRLSYHVGSMYGVASKISGEKVEAAKSDREMIIKRMNEVLAEGTVVCLPTTPVPAPRLGERLSTQRAISSVIYTLVAIASTAGAPQISLPLAEVDGLPLGVSLIGARGSDEMLITFAREVAARIGS
jgi:amidase